MLFKELLPGGQLAGGQGYRTQQEQLVATWETQKLDNMYDHPFLVASLLAARNIKRNNCYLDNTQPPWQPVAGSQDFDMPRAIWKQMKTHKQQKGRHGRPH